MRLCLAWIAVALLAAPVAAAEDREHEALQHLDVGVAAYRAGDLALARREFEAARRLVPDKANPYRWLGVTDVQLGDCPQALLELETFLKLVPANDDRVAEVTRLRDQCEKPPAAASPVVTAPLAAIVGSATPPPAPRKPLARRWWFWTALGGAAAVAAAGITLGVVLSAPKETRLPGIVCGTTGCAPAGAM
jgi:tetratricopeptide (TPR) repeat protein